MAEGVTLFSGVDSRGRRREGTISSVAGDQLVIDAPAGGVGHLFQVSFSFDLEGRRYFFAAEPLAEEPLTVRFPVSVYEAERRESGRMQIVGSRRRAECRRSRRARW